MMSAEERYLVVFRTIEGPTQGNIWSLYFNSKDSFEKWYGGKTQKGSREPISKSYAVVAQGVSDKVGEALCCAPSVPKLSVLCKLASGLEQKNCLG